MIRRCSRAVDGDDDDGRDRRQSAWRATSTTTMMILLFLLYNFFISLCFFSFIIIWFRLVLASTAMCDRDETRTPNDEQYVYHIVVALHIQFRYR